MLGMHAKRDTPVANKINKNSFFRERMYFHRLSGFPGLGLQFEVDSSFQVVWRMTYVVKRCSVRPKRSPRQFSAHFGHNVKIGLLFRYFWRGVVLHVRVVFGILSNHAWRRFGGGCGASWIGRIGWQGGSTFVSSLWPLVISYFWLVVIRYFYIIWL